MQLPRSIRPELTLVGRIREQGDVTGALERDREAPLVTSAGSRYATGQDLASLADEASKAGDLLVVDEVDLLHTEVANLLVRLAVSLIGRWWHGVWSTAPLEGNVFRVDVARGLLVMARRRGNRGLDRFGRRRRLRLRLAARFEELDFGGVYLGGLALLTVLAFPGTGLQPALDIHQASLVEVLAGDLGQVALADVPDHHVVVVGVFLLLSVGGLSVAIGRQREARHRGPARRVTHFRIA